MSKLASTEAGIEGGVKQNHSQLTLHPYSGPYLLFYLPSIHLDLHVGMFYYQTICFAEAQEHIKFALMTLNKHLSTRTYLVGHRLTIADVG